MGDAFSHLESIIKCELTLPGAFALYFFVLLSEAETKCTGNPNSVYALLTLFKIILYNVYTVIIFQNKVIRHAVFCLCRAFKRVVNAASSVLTVLIAHFTDTVLYMDVIVVRKLKRDVVWIGQAVSV